MGGRAHDKQHGGSSHRDLFFSLGTDSEQFGLGAAWVRSAEFHEK